VVYCEQCGAANDIMNRQCHRCGREMVPAEEPIPAAAWLNPSQTSANGAVPATTELGQGLELPEWLKRAAAQTPPAAPNTPLSAPNLPPDGFHVAGTVSSPEIKFESPNPSIQSAPPPRPLPPVPTADLPSAMPDWLKTRGAAQDPVVQEPDATDTSSFISENDLPEWIRQIAVADAAKKAEEVRLAAEAASVADADAPKRTILPGDASLSAPAANPWLSRRDSNAAADAWGNPDKPGTTMPSAQEEARDDSPLEPFAYDQSTPAAQAQISKRSRKLSLPSVSLPTISKPGSASGPSSQTRRVVLLGAAAVLVLLLLVMLVL
jgi:hypothetical protein